MAFEITILVICFLAIVAIGTTIDYARNVKKYVKAHRIDKKRKTRYERLMRDGAELIDW